MRRIVAAACGLVGLALLFQAPASATQPTTKKNWTFNLTLSDGDVWQSRVITMPDGRYRASMTDLGDAYQCDPQYQGCQPGFVHRCHYDVEVIRAGNRGSSPGPVVSTFNQAATPVAPPSTKTRTFYWSDAVNDRYYVEVRPQITPGLGGIQPTSCSVRVNLRKVG